jgi:hypothetical protein
MEASIIRIEYLNCELWEDPLQGWLWHRLDPMGNPTPNGEWGLAPSMGEAMEQVEAQLSENEILEWSERPAEKATAFGTVKPRRGE